MNYAKMMQYDTSNWEGITATIFFSGCRFKCLIRYPFRYSAPALFVWRDSHRNVVAS